MKAGTRVVLKNCGSMGMLTWHNAFIAKVVLDNGDFTFQALSNLKPLTVEDTTPEKFSKESRAGKAVEELESLPPQLPAQLRLYRYLMAGGRDLHEAIGRSLLQNTDDGIEIEILSSLRNGYLLKETAANVLSAIRANRRAARG